MNPPRRAVFLWLILLLAGPLLEAQESAPPAKTATDSTGLPSVDELSPRLAAHVAFLASDALEGRAGRGAELAAEWIARQFEGLGLERIGDDWMHPFAMSGLRGRNVVGVLPAKGDHPSGRHVIVSAHYDHLGRRGDTIHPGAADNASGVAALLELARILAPARLDCAVVFVAFDLEEMGLLGSFAWVKHPPLPIEDCDFFVTADILGRKALGLVDGMLFAQGWEWTPEMIPVLQKVGAPDEVDVACFWTDIAGDRSDFVAFKQAKVPHLFFSTGEFPEYHTPADRAEAVDARLLARQTRVIARCLKEILGSRERWHWRETPLADPVEFASLQRLANGLFRSEDARLTANLKAQAAAMGLYAGRVLAKGKVEPVNRRWLLNVARSLQGAIR